MAFAPFIEKFCLFLITIVQFHKKDVQQNLTKVLDFFPINVLIALLDEKRSCLC